MNDQRIRLFNIILLPFLLFLLTWIVFGFHFGWVDDVFIIGRFRGLYSGGVVITEIFEQHRGLSFIYGLFYRTFPALPWYSIFMYFYLYLSTVAIFYFLQTFLYKSGAPVWFISTILCLFFFLVWIENIYLMNFTRVALLLMLSGLLGILLEFTERSMAMMRNMKLMAFGMLFMLGYLTRYQVSPFPIFLFCLLTLIWIWADYGNKKGLIIACLSILGFVMMHQGLERIVTTEDQARHEKIWPYVLNLLDGYNFDPMAVENASSDPKEHIKLEGLRSWFFQDQNMIDEAFVKKIGGKNPFTFSTLKTWKNSLQTEYFKACCQYKGYLNGMNWASLAIAFLIFNLLLFGISLFLFYKNILLKASLFRQISLMAGFTFSILGVVLFLKMEGRLFIPYVTMLSLANVYLLFKECQESILNIWTKKGILFGVPLLLIVLCGIRMISYTEIANEKTEELLQKQKVINEIGERFDNQIVLFDLWSMMLIHGTPFENIDLDQDNQYAIWGEFLSNDYQAHLSYLETVCESSEFIEFYRCLYRKKHKVVFVLNSFRKELLENYLNVLYGEDMHFEKIETDAALYKLHNTFTWDQYNFAYYRLR